MPARKWPNEEPTETAPESSHWLSFWIASQLCAR
jgi:hypothetical protein